MFTGIIEEFGTLQQVKRHSKSMQLVIKAHKILSDITLGDSIAVNGVCLTVVNHTPINFTADVMPITFNDTNLAQLAIGTSVNLERAMAANGRFGGHIVSGHIDGVGKISSITQNENAKIYRIELAPQLLNNCIIKGSIALNGTSLTIMNTSAKWIEVSLIPHTQQESNLGQQKIGALINIECDILAKQLQQQIGQANYKVSKTTAHSNINAQFLTEHGFL